jgi:hypothetical protein
MIVMGKGVQGWLDVSECESIDPKIDRALGSRGEPVVLV